LWIEHVAPPEQGAREQRCRSASCTGDDSPDDSEKPYPDDFGMPEITRCLGLSTQQGWLWRERAIPVSDGLQAKGR
jgi:hypothetical protein